MTHEADVNRVADETGNRLADEMLESDLSMDLLDIIEMVMDESDEFLALPDPFDSMK